MLDTKIIFNSINIINYSSSEKYFEEMAEKGWLINKIILDKIFIFKKIEPQELKFTIMPKNKKIGEDFKDLVEELGWKYKFETFNFQIYYKEKDIEAIDLFTDIESESIEKKNIVKNKLINSLLIILFFGIILIKNFKKIIIDSPDMIREYSIEIFSIGSILFFIYGIVNTNFYIKFLLKNNNNENDHEKIKYIDSKLYIIFNKIFSFINIALNIIVILVFLYTLVILNNRENIYYLILLMFPMLLKYIGKIFNKTVYISGKKNRRYIEIKWKELFSSIFTVSGIVVIIFISNNLIQDKIFIKNRISNIEKIKLSEIEKNDINNSLVEKKSIFLKNGYDISLDNMEIEYSNLKNESLAKKLVSKYISTRKSELLSSGKEILTEGYNIYIKRGNYINFDIYGVEKSFVNRIMDNKSITKKELINTILPLIIDKNIIKIDEKLQNADEIYYLSYEYNEILIRKGREVYKISGRDFSEEENINFIWEKLGI